MSEMNSKNIDTKMPTGGELHTGFGWEFTKECWNSSSLIGAFAAAGLVLGGLVGYILPISYTAKLEITASPNEKYEQVLSRFIELKGTPQEQGNAAAPELKIINDSIVSAVYGDQVFSKIMQEAENYDLDNQLEFGDLIEVTKLSPTRGLERFFYPGYLVEISTKNKEKIISLAKMYSGELNEVVNKDLENSLGEITKTRSKLNDLNFEVSKKKYKIDMENRIEYVQDSIDIARTGGFSKPIMPTQMPVTAQIPLQDAVPRYFFGYEVLEQEKKQIEINANDETKIPGYSDYVAESNRLLAMADFLATSKIDFVSVQILPSITVKNGLSTKLAVAVAGAALAIAGSLLFIALRLFRRKITA